VSALGIAALTIIAMRGIVAIAAIGVFVRLVLCTSVEPFKIDHR
jgi:hypothetical protein